MRSATTLTECVRLKGHKDQITTLQFAGADHLTSSCKDTLLKLWHIPTQHCLDTVVAHRSECWSSALLPLAEDPAESAVLLTAGSEGELKLWSLELSAAALQEPGTSKAPRRYIKALKAPTLSSPSHAHRISEVVYDAQTGIIGLQTADRTIEFARIRSEDELKKKQARRKKRDAKKNAVAEPLAEEEEPAALADRISSWTIFRSTSGKIKSFAFAAPASSREARGKSRQAQSKTEACVLLALSNNALQTFTVPLASAEKKAVEPSLQFTLALPGHRTDVRSLCLSSDDTLLASISSGSVKVWNRRTLNCIRTIEDGNGYGLCGAFLPGDRHVCPSSVLPS
jgi:U3 small nucleolar RNA-associated protein 12